MAERVGRGQIWLLDLPQPDKRRPVLVLSRSTLIPLLQTVTVAAVTSTLRGAPTEVALDVAEGLKQTSCVNLCNLFTVRKDQLRTFVGSLSRQKMSDVCQALAVATSCSGE